MNAIYPICLSELKRDNHFLYFFFANLKTSLQVQVYRQFAAAKIFLGDFSRHDKTYNLV